ncbi:MAG TPA: PadR family transcriptional regulator [Acidimicrobiales bacterium]|nr:PadR family transcriptional regulator [Acidimicrobiales bacterium]
MHEHDQQQDQEHDHYSEGGGRRRRRPPAPAWAGAWSGLRAGRAGGRQGHDEEGPDAQDHPWFGHHGHEGRGGPSWWQADVPFFWRGGRRGWGRARRGDVRAAILVLLHERPMHGYEIISELSDRTEGVWRPSAGSIYPTLQLLEDEGLISAEAGQTGGKRRFVLSDEGLAVVEELAKGPAPWDEVAAGAPVGARDLRVSVARLMPVIGQVAMHGGAQEYREAMAVLDEARRQLYTILAADSRARPAPEPAPKAADSAPETGPVSA